MSSSPDAKRPGPLPGRSNHNRRHIDYGSNNSKVVVFATASAVTL